MDRATEGEVDLIAGVHQSEGIVRDVAERNLNLLRTEVTDGGVIDFAEDAGAADGLTDCLKVGQSYFAGKTCESVAVLVDIEHIDFRRNAIHVSVLLSYC